MEETIGYEALFSRAEWTSMLLPQCDVNSLAPTSEGEDPN